MTPPPTILGRVMTTPWLANAGRRRPVFLVVALALGVLSVWPRPYLAKAELAPRPPAVD